MRIMIDNLEFDISRNQNKLKSKALQIQRIVMQDLC